MNPKSTSNQSSKPCTVLQYPSKKKKNSAAVPIKKKNTLTFYYTYIYIYDIQNVFNISPYIHTPIISSKYIQNLCDTFIDSLMHLKCRFFSLKSQSSSRFLGPFCQVSLNRDRNTKHAAKHCNALQRTATRGNTLQHTTTHCNTVYHWGLPLPTTHCNKAHCLFRNTLQHTTTRCNTLQQCTLPFSQYNAYTNGSCHRYVCLTTQLV